MSAAARLVATGPELPGLRFDNTYDRLPARFYARIEPTPVAAPRLIRLNHALAETLGLDAAALAGPEGAAVLAGNRVPAGAAFIALAYAGHQFGHFSPQLGDGRALLLGEVIGRDGQRRDLQLKGSGPTPFSRNGDGRAALGPVLREYLVSEAMAALGIPTTRALAAVETGEHVFRETALPGAVFTRVAASHLRIGTFQFFAARSDLEAVRLLTDYAAARHVPDVSAAANPALTLLEHVIARQAELVARWLLVGFVHGVMNTDNMSISGETIDYGPCAFLDAYDPSMSFSSIDHQGRYAYANQPRIAQWNLARLAEALLPLLDPDQDRAVAIATAALTGFGPRFDAAYQAGLRAKLGLTGTATEDTALCHDLLSLMAEAGADFTATFRALGEVAAGALPGTAVRARFEGGDAIDPWLGRWQARLATQPGGATAAAEAMRAVNPAFIPRNHRVEAVLAAAVQDRDFGPFDRLLDTLSRPFTDQPDRAEDAAPPVAAGRPYRTFCGT